MQKDIKESKPRIIIDAALLLFGVFSAGFGLKGFLIPNLFIDGGVMGISLLVTELTKFPLPILVFIINVPFIVLGYKQVSKQFALKTFLAIAALAIVLALVNFPVVQMIKC